MKFIGRPKNRYIKNTNAFLYVNLPHNRWMTSAQQLMDNRTTADMQAHNSCCAVHDSIFRNDRYYIFQQLILYLPTTYAGSSSTPSHIYQPPNPLSRTDRGTSIQNSKGLRKNNMYIEWMKASLFTSTQNVFTGTQNVLKQCPRT